MEDEDNKRVATLLIIVIFHGPSIGDLVLVFHNTLSLPGSEIVSAGDANRGTSFVASATSILSSGPRAIAGIPLWLASKLSG